ncbi:tRNA/rRNA pseudouridine synthase [Hamiltosporidium magnivora]|uniref:H/ACA ribonucleoprotein complex subunit CBF5 n=1 Tax=Hamiltosporidium magnivora TaxID=148818 RepID=A0A4Q9LHQ2_9MICR|nr:tRNA/rRNA pseudouridine synthase [Hamiltosporidium magnivora]
MNSESFKWSVLLQNIDNMSIKTLQYTPMGYGSIPENRKIQEYIKNGAINLDKPCNPSSHEVVTWIKNILNVEKTGHSGTLDPSVSGCLIVCIDKATRLVKSQQSDGKEYVCVIQFHTETTEKEFKKVLKKLTGNLFQRPPLMCAVKRNLRLRNIYKTEFIEFDKENKKGLFKVSCEAGTYIRTFCVHVGLLLGCGAHMLELRRTKSGLLNESTCVTLHDLKDAMHVFKKTGEEKYIRKVIFPLENLLIKYPRIMVKDSCVGSICHGAQLTLPGVLRFDNNIEIGTDVVIITTKGEAVALAISTMSSPEIHIANHGVVCKTKRVIMDKSTYPSLWGNKDDVFMLFN